MSTKGCLVITHMSKNELVADLLALDYQIQN
jgi:hypothetical protein